MRSAVLAIAPAVAVAVAVTIAGCGGSAAKRDARRLTRRCDVVADSAVSEEQARCIARVFGIRDGKSCPMQVDRPDGFGQPVYRVHESCNGLGVVISESTGRVLAIVSGDEILHD